MKKRYLLATLISCTFSAFTQAASVSDLLITEIMANPSAVSDSRGEWFELFNPTAQSIDLNGIILSDNGSNSFTISADANLFIDSGSYFVMARNGDANLNGGVIADYTYSGFTLINTSDQIIFSDDTGELLRFEYESGFVPNGGSMELINAVMLPENYAATTSVFGAGDFGTPGEAGAFSPSVASSPVPVPSAVWLMGSGLIGLLRFSRKTKV